MEGLGLLLVLMGVWVASRLATRSASNPATQPPASIHPAVKKQVEAFRPVAEREAVGRYVTVPLVLAVIARETGGISRPGLAGEVGLMQVSLAAWQDYQTERNDPDANPFPAALDSPDINIRVGAWFLDRKIDEMGGNVFEGLRAYNCGFQGAKRNPTCGSTYAEWVTKTGEPAFRSLA